MTPLGPINTADARDMRASGDSVDGSEDLAGFFSQAHSLHVLLQPTTSNPATPSWLQLTQGEGMDLCGYPLALVLGMSG